MTNRGVVGLLLVAAIIILFLLLYLFYPQGPSTVGPEKPGEPAKKSAAAPEVKVKPGEKPGPAPGPTPALAPALPAPAPPPQEKPQPVPPPPSAPPEKPLTKPEPAPAAPKEPELPALQPKKEYGLLAGSYRKYAGANKLLGKIKKQGQEAFIRRHRGKYQVWVGPFATPGEAKAAAKALNKKIKIPSKTHQLTVPVPK
jgi:cell division protein FtsN